MDGTNGANVAITGSEIVVGWNSLVYLQTNGGNPLSTSDFSTELTSSPSSTQLAETTAEFDTVKASGTSTQQAELQGTVASVASQTAGMSTGTTQEGAEAMEQAAAQSYAAIDAAVDQADDTLQLYGLSLYDPTDFPNGLFSIDGDVNISSAVTVTKAGAPAALSTTIATNANAPGGYVIPSSFTITIPSGYTLNDAAASYLTDMSAPSASPNSADAAGTVTLVSPAATTYGLSTTDTITGQIYFYGGLNTPGIELYLGGGIYLTGTIAGTGGTFGLPLNITFGETNIGEPLPLSSLTLAFTNKSTPIKADSCGSISPLTGSAIDDVASVAAAAGDNNDGYSASGNTAVGLSSIPTTVTNECPATVSKPSLSGLKTGKPAAKFTIKGAAGAKFKTATITLPKGVSGKKAKIAGAKVKVKGQNLDVTFKKAASSETVKITGLTGSAKLLKEKKVTFKVDVAYSENGKTVKASAATAVTVKI